MTEYASRTGGDGGLSVWLFGPTDDPKSIPRKYLGIGTVHSADNRPGRSFRPGRFPHGPGFVASSPLLFTVPPPAFLFRTGQQKKPLPPLPRGRAFVG